MKEPLDKICSIVYNKGDPILFEVSTKLQAAQDPDSAAMVDYIIRNHIYDLAYFGDFGLPILVHNGLSSKQNSIASTLKTQEKIANKTLTNIINAYNRHK